MGKNANFCFWATIILILLSVILTSYNTLVIRNIIVINNQDNP